MAYRTGGTKIVYFDIVCAGIVHPPGEKLSLLTHFSPIKDFLDVYNVGMEYASQKYNTYKLRKY